MNTHSHEDKATITGQPLRALIVEDSVDDTLLLVEHLRGGGYEPEYARVDTAEALREQLVRSQWDFVFADFTMPHFSAFEALELLQETQLDLPFIIVSATIGEDRAVAAMKAGAHDYIIKNNLKRLLPAVERELREAHSRHERRQGEQKIHRLAYYDPLTQLPNRTQFLELVQQAFGADGEHPVALLLLDIDRFKEVNDTLGHGYGDMLLQQIGARLRSIMFESDTVARLGGDEFGVLLTRIAAVEDVGRIIEKIVGALEAPIMIETLPIAVEVSIGVALAPQHAADADGLLQHADVAMYHAKSTGSLHAVYDPEFDPHSPQRLALLGELRQAIDVGELVLHYQPKIELQTGHVVGAEALVRWYHPKRGMIPPDQFILIAEHTGLIKPLTLWVLDAALRQCLIWRRDGGPPRVAVNLSARSLHDPHLPQQIAELLRSCAVPAEALELEITESAIIVDPTRAIETLGRLADMGVRLSIDDFGTGYTSLGAIRKLPVHEIKIDKSFVLGMTGDKSEEVIARVILDLGRNLGFKVVAEGVETQSVARRLAILGCDFAQGYLISKPLPSEQFAAWFAGYRPLPFA